MVTGVDVSNHQGQIDWPAVKTSSVAFAYIKATEAGDFADGSFATNWTEAKATGIPVGAYHFFRQCKPGAEQAANFLKALPEDALQLPPVLDIEHMGPCPDGSTVPDVVAEITVFLDTVQLKAGCRPILYVTPEFNRVHISDAFADEQFWVRSIFVPPSFRHDAWVLWQYHNNGRRGGITGPVDLNAFRGSAADLATWITKANCFPPRP